LAVFQIIESPLVKYMHQETYSFFILPVDSFPKKSASLIKWFQHSSDLRLEKRPEQRFEYMVIGLNPLARKAIQDLLIKVK